MVGYNESSLDPTDPTIQTSGCVELYLGKTGATRVVQRIEQLSYANWL